MSTSVWLPNRTEKPQAKLRLFCFPFAGAGATAYQPWAALLPAHIELCAVELPGRWGRLKEPAFDRMAPLVEAVVAACEPTFRDKPYALFGHSLGAFIAFEVARALRRRGLAEPVHLFVSARRAPQLATVFNHDAFEGLDDDGIVGALQRYYPGLPPATFANKELLALTVPTMRADLTALQTYSYKAEPPFTCPITTFAGSDDTASPIPDLERWREQTTGPFELVTFAAHHFFINTHRKEIAAAVGARLG